MVDADPFAAEPPGGVIARLTGEAVTVRAWSTVTPIVHRLTSSNE